MPSFSLPGCSHPCLPRAKNTELRYWRFRDTLLMDPSHQPLDFFFFFMTRQHTMTRTHSNMPLTITDCPVYYVCYCATSTFFPKYLMWKMSLQTVNPLVAIFLQWPSSCPWRSFRCFPLSGFRQHCKGGWRTEHTSPRGQGLKVFLPTADVHPFSDY